MKKIFTLFTVSFFSQLLIAQPWTYDFGTGSGTANNTNAGSGNTALFTGTPSGGGTYRTRIGTGGGTMNLVNPGTTLGTGTEMQLNATTATSTNKFGVYDWTSPTTVAYLKTKIRNTSSGNGALTIALGVNTMVSDNQGVTAHYNNSLANFTINYASGAISSVTRRISGSSPTVTSHGFLKDTDQTIEIYANNGSSTVSYYKGGVQTLATQTWDLWVDGVKVVDDAAKAGTLAAATSMSGFVFFAESSTSNAANLYLDDVEYSNSFRQIVTSGTLSALTTTAGTASSNTTFAVTGVSLGADITVTAPSGFEVSTSAGSGFGSSVTLTQTGGTVSSTTIYVRLAAAAAGTYSGNVSCASTGATTVNVATASSTVNAAVGSPQTITFGALSGVTYGDADFGLTATASSGFAVSYASSNTAVATVSGSTVTIVGVGTTTITASQPGDGSTYQPAPDVAQNLTVSAKNLTVSGATADNKIYNRNTTATISGATLVGIVGADNVTVSGGGTFASMNAANGIVVTPALSLGGTKAANYTLTQPTGLTANITAKDLNITGISITNKTYNATTAVAITGTASLSGVVSGDGSNVTLGGSPVASFASPNVNNGISVTVSGYSISGSASGNYNLIQPTGLTANITVKSLAVTGLTATNKTYDATTAATLSGTGSLSGIVSGDEVNVNLDGTPAGTFSTASVGTTKNVTVSGYSISGTASGNYNLTPLVLTADITAKSITVSGVSAADKSYDGTTAATVSGGTLSGVETADNANVSVSASGTFAQSNVGSNIAVTVALSGSAASNYSLVQPGITANILIVACSNQTVTWNFNTASPSSAAISNLTVSTVTQGNNNGSATMISASSPSDLAGASAGNNAGIPAFTGALNTATSSYFEFTLTPADGYKVELSGINFGSRSSGTGSQAFALRSNKDAYATDLASGTMTTGSWLLKTASASFAGNEGTAVTFRLYGYDGAGGAVAGTINWRIDDLNLTVKLVPVLSSATTASTCDGSTFSYTPASDASLSYKWTRAAVTGISNAAVTTPQTSNPSEVLDNTSGSAKNVVYAYQIISGNCYTAQDVTVTVNTIAADDLADVTVCDSYTLPALTTGNYYTGSGKTGIALSAGNAITSSQTIYVYAETGTTPNCTDETSFNVTIVPTPTADDPADVTACDSYTLPALTVGNYFDGPGGTGTAYSAGNVISSDMTMYVYAETGTTPNCADENSFDIAINATPIADDPADVTACDSYTLPALTVGNYFDGPGGTGTAYSAGNVISSDMTLYVYAETGTTPNCTDENSFSITINSTPIADDPADVTACDSYTLPALTVGNYFDGPGGTGTAYSAGNVISSDMTMYVYAETGTTPNCADENSFSITINATPIADDLADVTACDSYTLPALTVGNYFDGPGGTGTAYSAGNVISSDMTLYVYAETGTTPNCTDENSFSVTINTTPIADDPADVTVCGSYTLPALTVGNYFSGTGGTGTAYSAGNVISSDMTMYVYATNGTCTDENSFDIAIDAPLTADAPADVINCGPYTLPALTVGNYYSGPGGTGTAYSAGNVISSDMTMYVYAANGTCTDENSFAIDIKAIPTITATVPASRCGTGSITLEATPSAGQIDWFMASSGGSSGYTGNTINLNLSSTKTYYVEASDNGCKSARTAITATIDFCSQVQASQCGTTLPNASAAIIADAAVGATHYRFEINGTTTVTKTTRTLYLANFTYTYGSTYSIKVAVSNDGTTFSAYGSACNITAPAIPTTQVQASQCGATLTDASTAVIADAVTGATHYRFRINGATTVTKTTRTLYVGNFTYTYGATYSIEVAASQDGTTFGAYGSACNITAPNAPATKVQASQCGTTLATNSTAIIADAITGATHYRFEINGGAQYVTKTTRTLYLGNFTYAANTTYAIKVAYSLDGGSTYQAYGASCNITSPSSSLKQDENIYEAEGDLMNDISVEAFPNPNSGDFTITSTHEGTFNVINEVGQLVRQIELTKENNRQTRMEGLQNGVYFVTGTINNEVITEKVMVIK